MNVKLILSFLHEGILWISSEYFNMLLLVFRFGKTESHVPDAICSSSDFLSFITHFFVPVACEPFTDFEIKVRKFR